MLFQQAVSSVVLRAPHLLLLPPDLMGSHLESLATLLGVPSEGAAVLCADQPLLLTARPQVGWFQEPTGHCTELL